MINGKGLEDAFACQGQTYKNMSKTKRMNFWTGKSVWREKKAGIERMKLEEERFEKQALLKCKEHEREVELLKLCSFVLILVFGV